LSARSLAPGEPVPQKSWRSSPVSYRLGEALNALLR
jgi:hypothetical protein